MKEKTKMEKKDDRFRTTMSVDEDVKRRFRAVCIAHGLQPKEQMEKLLREWTDQFLKKNGFGISNVG